VVEARVFFSTHELAAEFARAVRCCVAAAFEGNAYFEQRPRPLVLEARVLPRPAGLASLGI
jgi:hypothetical protein